MASNVDPAKRLAFLTAARAQVADDERVNAADMAKIAGMSWFHLTKMIKADPDLPVEKTGGMGVAWRFHAAAVLDHLVGRIQAQIDDRERRAQRNATIAGMAPEPSAPTAALVQSPGDLKRLAETQFLVMRLKREQGQLVDGEEVAALLADMMTTMQTETMSVLAKIDPAGQFDPALRAGIEDELANMLMQVRDKLDAWIEAKRGPKQ